MIAFGTVIYPSALKYIKEFINSINEQTYKAFDLVIVSDQVDYSLIEKELESLLVKYTIISSKEVKTPSDLRVDLIKQSKTIGYELLVMGDIDDLFDKNRVYEVVEAFNKDRTKAFYYNDLILFDGNRAFSDFPSITSGINDVLQFNYLGLSNNSINLLNLSLDFIDSLYECNSFVFDWYLFSRILCAGGKGSFVEKAITYYRIHNNNFVGVSIYEQLKKELEVKMKHYRLMSKYDSIYNDLLSNLAEIDLSEIQPNENESYWWNNIIFERTDLL